MSVLELIEKGTDLKHANEKRPPSINVDARKADQELRACPVCRAVWEVRYYNQTAEYKYYRNFPRYGKKKSVCSSCSIRTKNKYYSNREVLEPS